jgi:hypothetical protein
MYNPKSFRIYCQSSTFRFFLLHPLAMFRGVFYNAKRHPACFDAREMAFGLTQPFLAECTVFVS